MRIATAATFTQRLINARSGWLSCPQTQAVNHRIHHHWPNCALRKNALRRAGFSVSAATAHTRGGDANASTIYALSTAHGRAAIAVIRVSGPACCEIYHKLCPGTALPKSRVATVRSIFDPETNSPSDSALDTNALVLYLQGPRTVTGEDVLEFHVHGGPAVVKAVLAAIANCNSTDNGRLIRYAEAGEFTKRAFFNNRLDLTQVEALGDILAANTEQQRKLSVRGAAGALSKQYESWRERLLYARGELEALIDFSEDQHFDESPTELCESVGTQVKDLLQLLRIHRENAVRGELLRNGISIALLGASNAGKSSLLNCVIGREAAIVSNEAGTTRDIVEVGIDVEGFYCRLGDMAGLRQSHNADEAAINSHSMISEIEKEGMRRAKVRAYESDVVVVVVSIEVVDGESKVRLDPEVVETANRLIANKNNVVVVINKAEAGLDSQAVDTARRVTMNAIRGLSPWRLTPISCLDAMQQHPNSHPDPGQIQAFLRTLVRLFSEMTMALTFDSAEQNASVWQESLGASERHRLLLDDTIGHLESYLREITIDDAMTKDPSADLDLVVSAEHLRQAADCIAKITGRGEASDVEEVLGIVFEKFCVGK